MAQKIKHRSMCPVACMLDVLGDKWTLLVVRDLFWGKTRYGEFVESLEHIPTNLLAERLERLESSGIIESSPYQTNPTRYSYRLTEKGRALEPVLRSMAVWGRKHIAGTRTREEMEAANA